MSIKSSTKVTVLFGFRVSWKNSVNELDTTSPIELETVEWTILFNSIPCVYIATGRNLEHEQPSSYPSAGLPVHINPAHRGHSKSTNGDTNGDNNGE